MIDMGVTEDDRINPSGVKGEVLIELVGFLPPTLKKTRLPPGMTASLTRNALAGI